MADYNQLNKAKLTPFEMIFRKNKEINDAILTLIKTAYEDHHLETKERNKKLVECLEKDAKIIIEQLNDDTFKSKLQDNIESLIKSNYKVDIKISEDITKQILDIINEKLNKTENTGKATVKKTVIQNNTIKKLLLTKSFTDKISKISIQYLKQGHTQRINILKKQFTANVKISKSKNKKTKPDIVNVVTGGFDSLVKQFIKEKIANQNTTKSLIVKLQERISKSIKKTINKLKDVSKSIKDKLHNIKANPFKSLFKGSLKLVGGILKGVLSLVTFIVGGVFKIAFGLIKGFFKFATGIIKTSVKLIKGTITGIFKLTKGVIKGLKKLATGFLKLLIPFMLTPQGMYITGFITGFLITKIKNSYDDIKKQVQGVIQEIKEKKTNVINILKEKCHKFRSWIFDKMKDDKFKQTFIMLSKFVKNIPQHRSFLRRKYQDIRNCFGQFKKGMISAGSTVVGALIGKVIGKIIGAFFLPFSSIIEGVGTGLGAIIGNLIGEQMGKIPESSSDDLKNDYIITDIIHKYNKNAKGKKDTRKYLSLVKDRLKNNKQEREDRLKKARETGELHTDDLEEDDNIYRRIQDRLTETATISDEDVQTKNKHEKELNNITEKIDELYFKKYIDDEWVDGLINGIKGYKSVTTEFIQFSNKIKNKSGRGQVFHKLRDKIARIKLEALKVAIHAYTTDKIPYSQIGLHVNELMNMALMNFNVQTDKNSIHPLSDIINNPHKFLHQEDENPLDLTFENGDNINLEMFNIENNINRRSDSYNTVAQKLSQSLIEKIEKIYGVELDSDQKDVIFRMVFNLVRRNNLTRVSFLKNTQNTNVKRILGELNLLGKDIQELLFQGTGIPQDESQTDIIGKIIKSFGGELMKIETGKEFDVQDRQKWEEIQKEYGIAEKQKSDVLKNAETQNITAHQQLEDLMEKMKVITIEDQSEFFRTEETKKDSEMDAKQDSDG